MKRRIPFTRLWLVTDRRLKAGYRHRDQRGYERGYEAGRADALQVERVEGYCTGTLDLRTGSIQHDGPTCPIHEDPPKLRQEVSGL